MSTNSTHSSPKAASCVERMRTSCTGLGYNAMPIISNSLMELTKRSTSIATSPLQPVVSVSVTVTKPLPVDDHMTSTLSKPTPLDSP